MNYAAATSLCATFEMGRNYQKTCAYVWMWCVSPNKGAKETRERARKRREGRKKERKKEKEGERQREEVLVRYTWIASLLRRAGSWNGPNGSLTRLVDVENRAKKWSISLVSATPERLLATAFASSFFFSLGARKRERAREVCLCRCIMYIQRRRIMRDAQIIRRIQRRVLVWESRRSLLASNNKQTFLRDFYECWIRTTWETHARWEIHLQEHPIILGHSA